MKLTQKLLGLSVVMAASITAASAATTTVNNATSIVQTSTFSFVPNGNVTTSFTKFDSLGGLRTLESVFITVFYTKSGGQYSVDNESLSAATVSLTHSIAAELRETGLDNLNKAGGGILGDYETAVLSAVNTLAGVSIGADDGDSVSVFDASGSDYYRYEPSNITASDSGFMSNIAQFAGLGSYSLKVFATQETGIDGLSGTSQSFSPSTMTGYTEVTYNFSAVPEPSVFGLIGGLGFVVLLRRRR